MRSSPLPHATWTRVSSKAVRACWLQCGSRYTIIQVQVAWKGRCNAHMLNLAVLPQLFLGKG